MIQKCVVDTNVPKIANLNTDISSIPREKLSLVLACVEKIQEITDHRCGLVMDAGEEIYREYKRQLNMSGQPGVGDIFMKWVHDHWWGFNEEDRVVITKNGHTYLEFPQNPSLARFDNSDRKFVATALAHKTFPTIVVSEDRGWHQHKAALEAEGLQIDFLGLPICDP